MAEHQIQLYNEHLSYCADNGHLYDLLPISFTEETSDSTCFALMFSNEEIGFGNPITWQSGCSQLTFTQLSLSVGLITTAIHAILNYQ